MQPRKMTCRFEKADSEEVMQMAKGRLVSTSFWTDSKIVDDFLPEDKYLYLYCLTNPHTNLCGCYEVSIKQISDETGYDRDTVTRVLQRLDEVHGVVQYSAKTKELLIRHWSRYNWSASDKLNRPLLGEIQSIKNVQFRAFVAEQYNARTSVTVPFECAAPVETALEPDGKSAPVPKKKERHKYGQYGWVKLTDEEYARLQADLGEAELTRCISYVDESAQGNGNKNKWKDWNLVIRRCHREQWGTGRRNAAAPAASAGTMDDLRVLHDMFGGEGQ